MNTGVLRLMLLITVCILAPAVRADLLEQAYQCTREPGRLARLACFDALFGTPAYQPESGQVSDTARSELWRQAYAQAMPGPPRLRDTGTLAGLLVTMSAVGARPPRPLLVLQCHNNITELALLVPAPLSAAQVQIALGAETGHWRVRDNGFAISAGRGLPSIRVARSLLLQSEVEVKAGDSALDRLVFDLDGLAEALRPLRQRCGW